MKSTPPLATISPEQFLKRYWQKKPILIRDGYQEIPELPTPEELAGLSCDERSHSRIIIQKGGKTPWEVLSGPFSEKTFKRLPKTHWTLLVNSVERFIPSVHALLNNFTFLPNWRLDDVMISYAVKGGNVGAHVDNFDVFLIQVSGERKWSIEQDPRISDDYKPGLKVRLLKSFKPTETWTVKPGDVLYLPPRVPHHGVALTDDCMTVSVGFRASTDKEIVMSAFSSLLSEMPEGPRYSDPDLKYSHPGEISNQALDKIRDTLVEACSDKAQIARWFGAWTTFCDVEKKPRKPLLRASDIQVKMRECDRVCRNEGSRCAYAEIPSKILLFFDGDTFELPSSGKAFAQLLTDGVFFEARKLAPYQKKSHFTEVFLCLINSGALYFED